MAADKDLLRFVKEAKKRGFSDEEIKNPLLKQGWALEEVEKAFIELKIKSEARISIPISLPQSVLRIIEKRAKKNLLSTEEQIEDIIRRSAVTGKLKTQNYDNIDDLLVSIFSRRQKKKKESQDRL